MPVTGREEFMRQMEEAKREEANHPIDLEPIERALRHRAEEIRRQALGHFEQDMNHALAVLGRRLGNLKMNIDDRLIERLLNGEFTISIFPTDQSGNRLSSQLTKEEVDQHTQDRFDIAVRRHLMNYLRRRLVDNASNLIEQAMEALTEGNRKSDEPF